MFRMSALTAALMLTASMVLSAPASADTRAHGMRNAEHAGVKAGHRARKHATRHMAESSGRTLPGDVPFVGTRQDRAGNSYYYYRSGIGSPIPPVLR